MKKISLLLALAMLLSMLIGVASAANTTEQQALSSLEAKMREALFSADADVYAEESTPEACNPNEIVRVIVEMEEAPGYEIASTNRTAVALHAETAALKGQESVIQQAKRMLDVEPVHRSGYLVNTVSFDVCYGDIGKLEKLPGVASVSLAKKYEVGMFSAKEMTGVLEAWKMGQSGYTGKGMAIAIIDTGVNYLHQDMVQNTENAKYSKAEMGEKIASLGHGQWYSDKVPFGYSYVTGRNEILNEANVHGYHVAGISAATGDEEKGHISGVAPDAQIFAMQVYDSETASGGYTDDIICAIEDAVKLDADIINMSLGQDNGFFQSDRYMNAAVNRAAAEGVFVSTAAGNSGISTDELPNDAVVRNNWGLADTATVNDPSTVAGAVSVASLEGEGFMSYCFGVKTEDDSLRQIECRKIEPVEMVTDREFSLFFAGSGNYEDFFPDDTNPAEGAAGSIALVAYAGGISPDAAAYYAAYAGCAGVIVYNAEAGGDLLPSLKISGMDLDIPAAFIANEDGEYLKELCNSGRKVSFTAYEGYFFRLMNQADTASTFTSWGPTPTLEIKPELAAPGGNIMSLGDGTAWYYIMSGTSMATPFVSGAAAAVKQYLQESGMDVDNIPEFIRHTLMNTAMPVEDMDHASLYSVRQLGAGLIHVDDAVQNCVTVTHNGKAAIELLDKLGEKTTAELLLTNYGDTAVTYTLPDAKVYTDYTDPETAAYYDVILEDAYVVFDAASVTVPAKGVAKVSFTLTLDHIQEGHFAEGYLQFVSTTEEAPSLNIPFMGFMGNWDDGTIVDAPCWSKDAIIPAYDWGYAGYQAFGTGLVCYRFNQASYKMLGEVYSEVPGIGASAHVDPAQIAISPNADNFNDIAIPWLGLLRNAADIRFDVLDEAGNVIADLGTVSHNRKNLAGNMYIRGSLLSNSSGAVGWDGTVYDQSAGVMQRVPEGNYFIRLRSRVREGGNWQTLTMPVAVDLTAPEFESVSAVLNENGKVTVSFCADDAHGLNNLVIVSINGVIDNSVKTKSRWEYHEETGVYTRDFTPTVPIDPNENLHVAVMIADQAGNTAMGLAGKAASETGTAAYGLLNLHVDRTNYFKDNGEQFYDVYGFAPEGSTVTLNGERAAFQGTNFHAAVPLTGTVTPVEVEIRDGNGKELLSGVAKIVLDGDAPACSALIAEGGYQTTTIASGWSLMLNRDYPEGTRIPIRAKVSDTSNLRITCRDQVTGEQATLTPDANGYIHFEAVLHEVESGLIQAQLFLSFTDEVGSYRTMFAYVYNRSTAEYGAANGLIDITPKFSPELLNVSSVTSVMKDVLQPDGTFRVEGMLYNPVDSVVVNGKQALIDPESLLWYCDIPLEAGINHILVDSYRNGVQYPGSLAQVIYSETGPGLNLQLPEERSGVYYIRDREFMLCGNVTTTLDDAQIFINGTLVEDAYDFGHAYGEDTVTRHFTYPLHLQHGSNLISVRAVDYAGMETTVQLNLFYCPAETFRDVPRGVWYHEGLDFVYELGYMIGTSKTTFAPNTELTRGQLATILYRMEGEPEVTGTHPFQDVSANRYYSDAVLWAYQNKVVRGMSETIFAPDASITREQMVTMFARYADCKGVDITAKEDLSTFIDGKKVSPYAISAMRWAVEVGLIRGMGNGKLEPRGASTRAQVAAIVMRYESMLLQ